MRWFILIIFCLIGQVLYPQTYIIPDLQRDDFKNSKPWFSVNQSGTNHTYSFSNGFFKASLINPQNGGSGDHFTGANMENIGISTANKTHIYGKDLIIEAVIRVKTLNSLPPGSRGWGLWRSESLPLTTNQATWFMEQEADTVYPWYAQENWWQARVTRGLTAKVTSDLSFSNQEWHTYRIYRHGRDYYDLYVDDDPTPIIRVLASDVGGALTENYAFNCWNDDLIYHSTKNAISGKDTIEVYYAGWLGTSSFVVDFVEIRSGNYSPGYTVTPSSPILLRRVFNEIDTGVNDGLWKGPLNFTTAGGSCLILATAKAEEYDGYDGDDDLKIVVDSKDYGFNSVKSWNGDVDQGAPKTIIIDTTLSAGSHSLFFYSEVTPVLYDATVLGAVNGSIVLDQTLNETAPAGSVNYLWKSFDFSCDSGQVAVYISGSADEEPDWNYQNASIDSSDDDELRIELDDIDYGWGSDSSFVGNTLFGDSRSVLITQNVMAGPHTLRLYTNQTPTVYRVIVYAENKEEPSFLDEESLPARFTLRQNFPNPFNSTTAIDFETPQDGRVELDIFDLQGRLVSRLLEQSIPAGKGRVYWNGLDDSGCPVASGIYFYRLKSGSFTGIKKLTLLR